MTKVYFMHESLRTEILTARSIEKYIREGLIIPSNDIKFDNGSEITFKSVITPKTK